MTALRWAIVQPRMHWPLACRACSVRPSYIAESDAEQTALCQAYRAGAAALAQALGAWVLQSNWAQSLNLPAQRGFGAALVLCDLGAGLQARRISAA